MLTPFYPFEYQDKKKNEKVVTKVLYDSLKKSNEIIKFVTLQTLPFIKQCIEFATLTQLLDSPIDKSIKLDLGLFLRQAGHKWDAVMLLAIAQDYYDKVYKQNVKSSGLKCFNSEYDIEEEIIKDVIAKYEKF